MQPIEKKKRLHKIKVGMLISQAAFLKMPAKTYQCSGTIVEITEQFFITKNGQPISGRDNTLIKHLTYKKTLKIHLLFSFLITLCLVGCSTDRQQKHATTSIKLRTSNKQLQSNFDSCLRLTLQLLKTKVSDKEFYDYFSFDIRATGFEYDNVVLSVKDTLTQMPNSYQIFYDFLYKGDTLSLFRADFDSSLKVIDYRNFHLTAFRQFIDKKLTITRTNAIEIAVKNGMKRKDLDPILNCSADKFYWECKNDCDGCLYLDIDAKTGNIIGQGKVVYQY